MNSSIPNLNHRLNSYAAAKPEPYDVSNAIDAMTGRASAVINLLQGEFAFDSDSRLNDEIIFQALQSIEMELQDIKSTVEHFYQANKKPR